MNYIRIYTDDQGESQFEDVPVPLTDHGEVGFLSTPVRVTALQFRENKPDYDWDFHTAPARQLIVLLDGMIEIETSLGVVRQFKAGDIVLVEDVQEISYWWKMLRAKVIAQKISYTRSDDLYSLN